MSLSVFERTTPLEDVRIRADGTGRTIDAYAAVFNQRQEIRDQDGHYVEIIASHAFNRTLEHQRGRFQVLFNHGRDIFGGSSDRYSMPYGTPTLLQPDVRGLFTSTKVARTPLGDEILELVTDAIDSGDLGGLRGMSFSGLFRDSGRLEDDIATGLRTVVRDEIQLREFGLTPFPAYFTAQAAGVRAADLLAEMDADELAAQLATLPDDVRAELVRAVAPGDPQGPSGPTVDPPGPDQAPRALDVAQRQIALKLRLQGLQPQEH